MQLDFAWLGQGLAVDLANTYVPGSEADLLDVWPELELWPEVDRDELMCLRAVVTTAIDQFIDGQRIAGNVRNQLNEISRTSPALESLDAHGRLCVLSSLPGAVARDLFRLVSADVTLRRCPAPGCGMVYVLSRPTQIWCSKSCGNRARVARHVQLQQERRARAGQRPTHM